MGRRIPMASLAVIALNLLVIGFLVLKRDSQQALPGYGSRLPRLHAERADGTSIELNGYVSGAVGVLLVAPQDLSWQHFKYADTLLARYSSRGLKIATILPAAERARAAQLSQEFGSDLLVDTEGRIRDALGLHAADAATFIIRRDGTLELGVPYALSRDELRQFVEKLLLGRIHYSPASVLASKVNFPLRVLRAGASQPTHLGPSPETALIFITAAACATCNMAATYDNIALYVRQREANGARAAVLVSEFFPLSDVELQLSGRGLDVPVYQVQGLVHGLEDDYFTKRTEGSVLAVEFDPTGTLERVLPLPSAAQLTPLRNKEQR